MESIIKELWHGNIIPQEDSWTHSEALKKLLDTHIDLLCNFICRRTCIIKIYDYKGGLYIRPFFVSI